MKRFLKLMAALIVVTLTSCTDEGEAIVDLIDLTWWDKGIYYRNHWSEYLVPGSWAFLILMLLVYHYISLPGKKKRSLRSIPTWFMVAFGLSLVLFHFADESLWWFIPLMLILMIRFQPPELTSLAVKKNWKTMLALRYWPKNQTIIGVPNPSSVVIPQVGSTTISPAPDTTSKCPNCGGYLGPKICTAGCGYRRPTTPPPTETSSATSTDPSPENLADALDLDEFGS